MLALPLLAALALGLDDPPTYEKDVRPVLAKRCNVCHNAGKVDKLDITGGLALDSYDAALKGTSDHAVVLPGKGAESELFKRLVETDEDLRMPLSDKPLSDREQALVKRWIDAGAPKGEPLPVAETNAHASAARRVARSIDVVVPTDAKVPANTPGFESSGPVQYAIKAGPLPSITALAFRGDGRLLAVGTHGSVVVWDLVDGRPAAMLNDVPGPVHALAFNRDGRRLAVGSGLPARTGSVRVYAVPGGALLHDFTGHTDVVFGLAFRPDGGQLASASFDATVRFWDLNRGRPAGVFRGHSDFVYDVAYDRDGRSLLSVSKDRSIKRIDVSKNKELRTYSNHNQDVLALAVSPKTGQFVTAGEEPQLRWWGAEDEKPAKLVGGHGGPVHQLAFSADGSRLISAGGDGSVRLWDGSSGSSQKTLAGTTEWQYAVALSDDGALAAAGGWDGLVRIWDANAGALRATLMQPPGDETTRTEWLAVAPAGYFAASPWAADLLRCRVGGKDVEASAARPVFEQPDALAQSLRGEAVPPAFK